MSREEQAEYIKNAMEEHRRCVHIAEGQVDRWNRLYDVGTNVWATKRNGEKWKTSTRTAAQVSYDEAIIYVKGDGVAYTLDNIKPLRRKTEQ